MSTIAIITARGGSKRIPGKNIRDFLGMPIIAYSIRAALESRVFDEVMVSTDSEEIAQIARSYGASVPFMRSASASNDYATTADVIREVLECYRDEGKAFDSFCCIYPTAPFVTAEKLKKAFEMLQESGADSLIPVVPFSFPPQRGIVIREGKASFAQPQYANARSQDLEPIYHDIGQFYVCRTTSFLKYEKMVMPNTIPFVMPEEEVQDIDNLSDWAIAEVKYKTFILGKGDKQDVSFI